MKKELSKLYEPNKVEDKIYKYWLDGGFSTLSLIPRKSHTV